MFTNRFAAALGAAALSVTAAAATAQTAPEPTDAHIAHIAYTAGQIDIAAGKQALKKSRTPEVRSFAEQMVRDHTAVNDQALALVKKLNVTPGDNPTSASLSAAAKVKSEELAKLNGPAFDRAYLQNEVAFHRTVNGALQSTLIPKAQNAELKSLLQTGLTLFKEHQQHAEMVSAELR